MALPCIQLGKSQYGDSIEIADRRLLRFDALSRQAMQGFGEKLSYLFISHAKNSTPVGSRVITQIRTCTFTSERLLNSLSTE